MWNWPEVKWNEESTKAIPLHPQVKQLRTILTTSLGLNSKPLPEGLIDAGSTYLLSANKNNSFELIICKRLLLAAILPNWSLKHTLESLSNAEVTKLKTKLENVYKIYVFLYHNLSMKGFTRVFNERNRHNENLKELTAHGSIDELNTQLKIILSMISKQSDGCARSFKQDLQLLKSAIRAQFWWALPTQDSDIDEGQEEGFLWGEAKIVTMNPKVPTQLEKTMNDIVGLIEEIQGYHFTSFQEKKPQRLSSYFS